MGNLAGTITAEPTTSAEVNLDAIATLIQPRDPILLRSSAPASHSQEDGAFKSDRTTIGEGSTIGVGAFVHYGVRMGEGSVLAPDSFLMKGEEIPPRARWGGNPTKEI